MAQARMHTDFFFNVQLHHYDHKIDSRKVENGYVGIFVSEMGVGIPVLNSQGAHEKLKERRANGQQIPTLEPVLRELIQDTGKKGLLVGLTLGTCDWAQLELLANVDQPDTKKTPGRPSKGALEGRSIQSMLLFSPLPYDNMAFRVIAHRGDKGSNASFYALFEQDPDSMLCKAVRIKFEDVFFFPEYRDDEVKTRLERTKAWKDKVSAGLDAISPQTKGGPSGEDVEHKEKPKEVQLKDLMKIMLEYKRRPKDVDEAQLEEAEKLLNQLGPGTLSALQDSEEAQEQMARIDPSLKMVLEFDNKNLCKLIHKKDGHSDGVYKRALIEIRKQWPKLGEELKDEERLKQVFRCANDAGITVSYGRVRRFLVTCSDIITRDLTKDPRALDDPSAFAEIGQFVNKTLNSLLGANDTAIKDPSPSTIISICEAVRTKLHEINTTLSETADKLKVEYGSSQRGPLRSTEDLYNDFGRAADADAAKAAIAGLFNEALRVSMRTIQEPMEDQMALVKWFDKLIADLVKCSEEDKRVESTSDTDSDSDSDTEMGEAENDD
ncbi:uncharacterized protein RCC_04484 [Ramularia collo-cygni]|uniref:Uncharacterized protein n=1 Tax=Ramularia collo-cygni TaxID=112498 RepID=A0A2D3UZI7_9PEZI|nr:uncharacterized protein RCC_04484 [Ramularia collo-cygni]CZT18640.1 uncharacterized protein RCC_04484 [Ramularia collo-cygni]